MVSDANLAEANDSTIASLRVILARTIHLQRSRFAELASLELPVGQSKVPAILSKMVKLEDQIKRLRNATWSAQDENADQHFARMNVEAICSEKRMPSVVIEKETAQLTFAILDFKTDEACRQEVSTALSQLKPILALRNSLKFSESIGNSMQRSIEAHVAREVVVLKGLAASNSETRTYTWKKTEFETQVVLREHLASQIFSKIQTGDEGVKLSRADALDLRDRTSREIESLEASSRPNTLESGSKSAELSQLEELLIFLAAEAD
ncbi:MAG: hypothetical protein V4692_04010 [Bdellovibrionota bacterium]